MPVVEKTSGGAVNVRGIGDFVVGDRAEVNEEQATYLVDKRGDFEFVDADNLVEAVVDDVRAEESAAEPTDSTLKELIDNGNCPWCDEYDGENVGMHASSAHPDEWTAYKED